MSLRVAVALADGFEEVEAVTPIDFLRRAGVDLAILGVGTRKPVGAKGVQIFADGLINDATVSLDGIVLPGGLPGAENLSKSRELRDIVLKLFSEGKLIGAICAAPALALGSFGILKGRQFTCYPGFETHVTEGTFLEDRVVQDGNLITSRGVGTAADFSLALVNYLLGDKAARKLAQETLHKF